MDEVLPDLNNVARHIRPFVVVTWAWRRAKQLADAQGRKKINIDALRDFVDRIEVIYAWSQFLANPNADLPGRRVLNNLLGARTWTFGGSAWRKRRDDREYSTALTAPINYGPGLKTLGWLRPHYQFANVLIPTAETQPALDAFEALIEDRLDHPAFSRFGSVEVRSKEAARWSKAWSLEKTTRAERVLAAEMLFGSAAPLQRRKGGALMIAAANHTGTTEKAGVTLAMAGLPSKFRPPAELRESQIAWRRVQVRQLFRLALEGLFYWILFTLEEGPKTIDALVNEAIGQLGGGQGKMPRWLESMYPAATGPTLLIDQVQEALGAYPASDLLPCIFAAISFCLREAPDHGQDFERVDRLPLYRAKQEVASLFNATGNEFVRHVIEAWILAQHAYWSVGRGLADARSRGKLLLRLKVILDEGGWTLTPGASRGSPPVPTADRLETALNLATECRLLP
jgi:hypothetical protein